MIRNYLVYLLGLAILLLIISIWLYSYTSNYHNNNSINLTHNSHSHLEDEFHIHADFLVILNNTILNFSKEKFMSELHNEQHPHVHLHDMNGKVIHFHEENITFEMFFKSLNIHLNESCFINYNNISYCQDDTNSLQMFVNGEENRKMQNYVAEDLDRILILFGNYSNNEIDTFMNMVSNDSCIYSMICEDRIPEGGINSSCVTGASCLLDLDFLN